MISVQLLLMSLVFLLYMSAPSAEVFILQFVAGFLVCIGSYLSMMLWSLFIPSERVTQHESFVLNDDDTL